jgi:hypothetical protein
MFSCFAKKNFLLFVLTAFSAAFMTAFFAAFFHHHLLVIFGRLLIDPALLFRAGQLIFVTQPRVEISRRKNEIQCPSVSIVPHRQPPAQYHLVKPPCARDARFSPGFYDTGRYPTI